MSKLVLGAQDWAGELPPEALAGTHPATEGKPQ